MCFSILLSTGIVGTPFCNYELFRLTHTKSSKYERSSGFIDYAALWRGGFGKQVRGVLTGFHSITALVP
jgi:hypothetical protein